MSNPLKNLGAVFRDATDPILIEDLDGRVVDLNDEAVKTYGFTRDELVGRPIKEIVPPERHDQADDLLRRCRAGESVRSIGGVRVAKDGHEIPVLLSLSLLSGDDGEPVAIASFAKDITSLRQSEAEARRMSLVFMNAADPIVIEDLSGDILDLNLEAVRTYGWERDRIIGQSIKRIVPPERHEQADELLQNCLSGLDVRNVEGLRVSKDGTVYDILITLSLLRDENDEPIAVASIAKNITSLRQAEAELKSLNRDLEAKVEERTSELAKAEERSRLLLESTQDGIFGVDTDGVVTFVNSSAARMLVFQREEILGKSIHSLVHHSHKDGTLNPIEQCPMCHAYTKGTSSTVDDEVLWRKDGASFDVEYTSMPIRQDDVIIGAVVVFRDISERKKAEEAVRQAEEELRASEKRFRGYFEHSQIGMAVTSPDRGWLEVNAQLRQMLGYDLDELRQMTWAEFTHPDDLEADLEHFGSMLAGDIDNYTMDKRFVRKDGEVVYTNIAVSCVRDEAGSVDLVLASLLDITERKQAELALKDNEERLDLALKATKMGLWDVDTRTDRLVINDEWARMLGYRREEIPERLEEWSRRLHPDDAEYAADMYRKYVEERAPFYEMEFRMQAKDGSYRWILSMGKAARWDTEGNPERVIGTHLDITERKQAEQTLREAKERLTHELAVARELSDAADREHQVWLQGESIPVRALRESIETLAGSDDPVLMTGPNGAGQEAVARAIHRSSPRAGRPFIYVACPHVSTADDTAFGFRSANSDQPSAGKMALADGGTLYLEGIEALSRSAQENLLKTLRDAAGQRAASQKPTPDVRVISYASGDLTDAVRQGDFDVELARVLGARRLAVPSLAERRDDVVLLANNIVAARARSLGKALDGLSSPSEEMLADYSWPGNLGELQSVVERAVVLATGTSVEIPADLLREGRRVGGYTLERQLGSGAMGEVWLARHALLARPSAVKLIRQESLQGDSDAREMHEQRFQREAQATSQLRSPHTVELYDFGVTEDGDFYYVMEYLNGVDLESLVTKYGPVDPARAVFLLCQACMSLGEAHAAGLVHRDVKPANLFTCRLGPHFDFLKLLDFGIVKTASGVGQTVTAAGQIKGTPTSLSPEVVQGEEAGFESDIYGLGCVAYWLLSGHHVFQAPSVMALLMQHVSKTPEPLSEHRSDLPDGLDELVLRCLSKEPADRPGSALELGEQLASIPFDDPWDTGRAEAWWNENMSDANNDASTESVSETMVWDPGETE
jgi:eukaryotic-like serine/threonine-protein kinase